MSEKEPLQTLNLSQEARNQVIAMMLHIEGKSSDLNTELQKAMKKIHPASLVDTDSKQELVLEGKTSSD